MITIHIPNTFIPERTYAIRTLLGHYCGVPVEVVVTPGITSYELHWQDKSITIADDFFGKIPEGKSYLDKAYLPEKIVQASAYGLEDILILYGKEHLEISRDKIVCDVDLFAGVFFMLTRWEEALTVKKDQHDRFPAAEAVIVKTGNILRPIVDEYALLIRNWLLDIGYLFPEVHPSFKLHLTCDVDIPYYWRSKPAWKILGGRLLRHWNLVNSVKDIAQFKSVQSKEQKDPYDTFDYLMSLAEKNDTRVQFNFLSGGKTNFEGYYHIEEPHIKDLIAEMVARGHSIGLHPSYDTFKDSVMIEQEKQALEKSAGLRINKSRQHYLRFALPQTWSSLSEAGIAEDSTLGYAAEPGFRCGTCKPFPVFDIHKREQLPLIERPLLIMDVSFRMYKNLSVEESISLCEKIKAEVRKHNGELVVLWHNSSLSEVDGWEEWKDVLENLMGHFDSAQ